MPPLPTTEQAAHIAIGIGANLGNARTMIEQTIRMLQEHEFLTEVVCSKIYRTAPIQSDGPDYFNAVVIANTERSPQQVLSMLLDAETTAGRERPYRNAPRSLDLDLLLYDTIEMNTPTLTLPHPRMHLRAFVLVPLAQIAPDAVVPGHGPVHQLLDGVRDQRIEALS